MPQDLRKIRDRKGMSVNQLALRSGISGATLIQYERGRRRIPASELRRLAKALYVEEWDINAQSTPPPPLPSPTSSQITRRERPAGPARPTKKLVRKLSNDRERPKPKPARDSQIAHLLTLAARFNMDRAALETEIGKRLDELTMQGARSWNGKFLRRIAEEHPPYRSVDRKRAYLPEGVDSFELAYLQEQQEAGALLHFTLFDGQTFDGRVVGFSPYLIVICEPGGDEVALNKLAIAFYRISGDPE